MNQITNLEPQKKNPKRANIFLDGKFAFGLSQENRILNKLRIGENLTNEKIGQLIFADQVERLFEKAIKFLSFRPRSEKEVRNNLLQKLRLTDKGEEEKKNFEKSVNEVIKKLVKLGLLNDLEFTTWWVEQRTKFKKISLRVIKSELYRKGIDKETIEEVLNKAEINSFELALAVARKKEASYKKLEPKKFREKINRFLASRGFDWEEIKRVVDTLSKEE